MQIINLFTSLPKPSSEEFFEELVGTDRVKIERIVSQGHASPPGFWYDQDFDEWVVVLQGSAGLSFSDHPTSVILRAGDAVNISAHRKHRVDWTDPEKPTIWLAVHY